MSRGQLARRTAVAGALLLACAGCGGGSGFVALSSTPAGSPGAHPASARTAPPLPPDQVTDAVKAAYQGARAVHVKGSVKDDDGSAINLDLQLNKDSGSGTIGGTEMVIPVLFVGGVYYFQFTDSVIKASGGSPSSAASRRLRGKWVPSTSSLAADIPSDLKDMLNYDKFVGGLVDDDPSDVPTKPGEATTVNGVPALHYALPDDSTIDVATAAPHYLLRATGPPSDPGTMDFTGWDQPVPVTKPPASAIYSG
ncbi:MAG: hypothetical protein ACJ73S_31085 [Mycobacteriales bacterium]